MIPLNVYIFIIKKKLKAKCLSFRSICDLLDPWTCGSAPRWTQLREMQRTEIQTLAAAPRRPQFRH